MNAMVSRYADSPALGMWEPMSEAEASTCPAAIPERAVATDTRPAPTSRPPPAPSTTSSPRSGRRSTSSTPSTSSRPASSAGVQCGLAGSDYQSVGASPGIDVLSVHDYYGSAPLGGDQWNGLAVRFAQAKALDKPIITGEAGIEAGIGQSGCMSLQQRSLDMSAKMTRSVRGGRQRIPGVGLAHRSAGTVQLQQRSGRQLAPQCHRVGSSGRPLDPGPDCVLSTSVEGTSSERRRAGRGRRSRAARE